MKLDPIDQLGARLFEVARDEVPPVGAVLRAQQAARREISQQKPIRARFARHRNWTVAGAGLAIAAAFALQMRPKESPIGISAEPTTVAQREPEHRTIPRVAAPSEDSSVVPSSPAPPKLAGSNASAPVRSAKASLSDELSALKIATNALSAGDTQAALSALDRYDRVLKGQKMRAEATLLRIEALSRAGQVQAASALAQRFVEQNPGSPLVDRARSFVHEEAGR